MMTSQNRRVGPASRVGLAAALAAAAGVGGCNRGGGQAAAGGGMPPGTPVTAVAAVAGDVPVYIDEIGKTSASETVTIQPQVSGVIIRRSFKDGADLHKGQLLFEIDPRPFKATLDQAQGQLKKDQASKASADWNVGQDQLAITNHSISDQQMHNDMASRDTADGAIVVDRAMIDQANLNLEYATIKSPIDGRAGQRLVDVGNVVNASGQATGTSLLVINRIDPIYADFTVNEAELARVQQYMGAGTLSVEVETPADTSAAAASTAAAMAAAASPKPEAAPGTDTADDKGPKSGPPPAAGAMMAPTTAPARFQPRTGKLIFLDNTVQDGSGTVRLRAELPNADHHFWPGQYVNVRLVLTVKKGAVLVPNIATQVSQQGLFVYTVMPSDRSPTKQAAMQTMVTLGQRQGNMVVVDTGLSAGDQVVTTGQLTLQPGAPVMVINAGGPPMQAPVGPPKAGPGMLKSPPANGAGQAAKSSASAATPTEGSRS